MNGKKLLALFVVLCMTVTCFACVTDTGSSETNKAIQSDEAVIIDIDDDFDGNAKELKKLGITNEKDWTYDTKERCYVLTLDDVRYETTANVALGFVSESTVKNPKVIMKLEGENEFVSGSDNVISELKNYTAAIFGVHLDKNGESADDITIELTGNGKITTDNVIKGKKTIGAAGIRIYGTLMITGGASVFANAGSFEHVSDGEVPAIYGLWSEVYSAGVYVLKLYMDSDNNVTKLDGKGGDIDTTITGASSEIDTFFVNSVGITSMAYECYDSIINGHAGNVVNNIRQEGIPWYVESRGISDSKVLTYEQYSQRITHIDRCRVTGTADKIVDEGLNCSIGISFSCSDDGIVEINNSIVIGVGGDSESINSVAQSEGICVPYSIEVSNSFIYGRTGSMNGSDNYGVGITCYSLTVKQSIIDGSATGEVRSEDNDIFYGTSISEFNIEDSELYVSGTSSCMNDYVELSISPGYTCRSFIPEKVITNPETELKDPNIKSAELIYKHDIIFTSEEYGVLGFERTSGKTYTIGEYTGYVPDGMEFSHYECDGKIVHEGEKIQIDDYIIIEVVFKEKSSGTDFPVEWIAAIITLVVGAFALFLLIIGSRRRKDEY